MCDIIYYRGWSKEPIIPPKEWNMSRYLKCPPAVSGPTLERMGMSEV